VLRPLHAEPTNAVAACPGTTVVHCRGYDVLVPARGLVPVQMHEPLSENPAPTREDALIAGDEPRAWAPRGGAAKETSFSVAPASPPAARRTADTREDRSLLTAALPTVEPDTALNRDSATAERGWDAGWLAHGVHALERADDDALQRSALREDDDRSWRSPLDPRAAADAADSRGSLFDFEDAAAASRRPAAAAAGRATADWLTAPSAKPAPSSTKWTEAPAP